MCHFRIFHLNTCYMKIYLYIQLFFHLGLNITKCLKPAGFMSNTFEDEITAFIKIKTVLLSASISKQLAFLPSF